MKILLDDPPMQQKILRELYDALPGDPARSQGHEEEVLFATTILMEVYEYVAWLKSSRTTTPAAGGGNGNARSNGPANPTAPSLATSIKMATPVAEAPPNRQPAVILDSKAENRQNTLTTRESEPATPAKSMIRTATFASASAIGAGAAPKPVILPANTPPHIPPKADKPQQQTPSSSSSSGPKYLQNDTNKVQNICLPPGAKIVNLPGLGQAIMLPVAGAMPTLDNGSAANPSPTIIQLAPGSRIPMHNPVALSTTPTSTTTTTTISSSASAAVAQGQSLLKRPPTLLKAKDQNSDAPAATPVRIGPIVTTKSVTSTIMMPRLPGSTAAATHIQIASKEKEKKEMTMEIEIDGADPLGKVANSNATKKDRFPVHDIPVFTKISLPADAAIDPKHGLICKPDCRCPLSEDRYPMRSAYKLVVCQHLQSSIVPAVMPLSHGRPDPSSVEWFKVLMQPDFQMALFNVLVNGLPRKELQRLMRVVGAKEVAGKYKKVNSPCIFVYESPNEPTNPLSRGLVKVWERVHSLHQLLFKLFRVDAHREQMGRLILSSRVECQVNSDEKNQCRKICVNPWHFEKTDTSILSSVKMPAPHDCERRLRITFGSAYYVCPFCQKSHRALWRRDGDGEGATPGVPAADSEAKETEQQRQPQQQQQQTRIVVAESKDKAAAPSAAAAGVVIKQEQPDYVVAEALSATPDDDEQQPQQQHHQPPPQRNLDRSMIDKDLEDMIGSYERDLEAEQAAAAAAANGANEPGVAADHIKIEQDPVGEDEDGEENPLQIDEGLLMEGDEGEEPPAAAASSAFILDDSGGPATSAASASGTASKRRSAPNFRCWKCLQWFQKSELATHNCLPKLLNGGTLFCCQYCGFCVGEVVSMKSHVARCRRLGLTPIDSLRKAAQDDDGDGSPAAKRARKLPRQLADDESASSLTCHQCAIVFANLSELALHSQKPKCKSIQCAMCNRFYANSRTHQNHECQVDGEDKEGILILNDLSREVQEKQPVKCLDCNLLLRSHELLQYHQTTPANCARCNIAYTSMCEFLLHGCGEYHNP